jgi:hypothetical protein
VIVVAVAVCGSFTDAERARATEMRAWAARPENIHANGEPLDASIYGGVFSGIRACLSISFVNGKRYRVATFSDPTGAGLPCGQCCAKISIELFGFDTSIRTQPVVDPTDPLVVGRCQELPASSERPS